VLSAAASGVPAARAGTGGLAAQAVPVVVDALVPAGVLLWLLVRLVAPSLAGGGAAGWLVAAVAYLGRWHQLPAGSDRRWARPACAATAAAAFILFLLGIR
jgi:hypothetical protein